MLGTKEFGSASTCDRQSTWSAPTSGFSESRRCAGRLKENVGQRQGFESFEAARNSQFQARRLDACRHIPESTTSHHRRIGGRYHRHHDNNHQSATGRYSDKMFSNTERPQVAPVVDLSSEAHPEGQVTPRSAGSGCTNWWLSQRQAKSASSALQRECTLPLILVRPSGKEEEMHPLQRTHPFSFHPRWAPRLQIQDTIQQHRRRRRREHGTRHLHARHLSKLQAISGGRMENGVHHFPADRQQSR